VGRVATWRAASPEQTVARIDQETLPPFRWLDGLLSRDGVGPADFTAANSALRLDKVDGLALTDQVALAGEDTATGAFGIVLGVINNIDPAARRIALAVLGNLACAPKR